MSRSQEDLNNADAKDFAGRRQIYRRDDVAQWLRAVAPGRPTQTGGQPRQYRPRPTTVIARTISFPAYTLFYYYRDAIHTQYLHTMRSLPVGVRKAFSAFSRTQCRVQ